MRNSRSTRPSPLASGLLLPFRPATRYSVQSGRLSTSGVLAHPDETVRCASTTCPFILIMRRGQGAGEDVLDVVGIAFSPVRCDREPVGHGSGFPGRLREPDASAAPVLGDELDAASSSALLIPRRLLPPGGRLPFLTLSLGRQHLRCASAISFRRRHAVEQSRGAPVTRPQSGRAAITHGIDRIRPICRGCLPCV